MLKSIPVDVTSYHGKAVEAEQHHFISLTCASAWLVKHYNRSDYNHARVHGRLCFTFDQADRVLHELQRDA